MIPLKKNRQLSFVEGKIKRSLTAETDIVKAQRPFGDASMGFTRLRANGSNAIVMDEAFFARSLDLATGDGSDGTFIYGDAWLLEVNGSQKSTLLGPFTTGSVPPRVGLSDLFSDGAPEFVTFVRDAGIVNELQYYSVFYYDLQSIDAPYVTSAYISYQNSAQLLSLEYAVDATGPQVSLARFIGATVDSVYDREANNEITCFHSDDLVFGYGGDDIIFGDPGSDILYGGSGDDTIFAGTYSIFFVDEERNMVFGEDGNDSLTGSPGLDSIYGGRGADILDGSEGVDRIEGGTGNDHLTGGGGRDILKGGAGNDSFSYGSRLDFGDRIIDFNPANDTILIAASGFFFGLVAGMDLQATGRFSATPAGVSVTRKVGQFIYDTDDGKLFWDTDGRDGAAAQLVATFTGAPVLTAADLVVVA